MKLDPAWVVATIAVAGALIAGGRWLWLKLHKLDEFLDDWRGESERPGYSRRPGMPERIAKLEAEFAPNHGSSMRDALNRVELVLAAHTQDPDAHQPKGTENP